MGLFSKEACAFCGTEVGMLKRSKLQTKEYICNDCKKKTNPFARMDYTSKDNAQRMMDTLAQEAADFEKSFDSAENRFQSAERSFKTWDLGSHRVQYRCNTRLDYKILNFKYNETPDAEIISKELESDPAITHVSMVHCETTSGILNNIEAVAKTVKALGKVFIVDAMSSFGGIDIEIEKLGIDFIISSANKCIQGVPGFSFIICRRSELAKCEGNAVSLSLDLYDQWKGMEKDGKWRFTSPTHVVLAFAKALEELEAEGGVKARFARYSENNRLLIEKMTALGFRTYLNSNQSPIITTFLYPDTEDFTFEKMYNFIKERGYAIYPGKVTDADVFRIGNIGEIYIEDIEKLCGIFEEFFRDEVQI